MAKQIEAYRGIVAGLDGNEILTIELDSPFEVSSRKLGRKVILKEVKIKHKDYCRICPGWASAHHDYNSALIGEKIKIPIYYLTEIARKKLLAPQMTDEEIGRFISEEDVGPRMDAKTLENLA